MNEILFKINMYLEAANRGEATMPPGLVEDFKEACGRALERQFNERSNEYSIRMSGIGRPICQQKLEQQGIKGSVDNSLIMRFLLGDLIEAASIAVMKAAGIEIQAEQEQCELQIGGINMKGTLDVEIDDKVWDIKSSSGFAFNTKFSGAFGGFNKIEDDDVFGYIPQGYLYAESRNKPFGGWIVVDKASGEFSVTETPILDGAIRKKALKVVADNIKDLRKNPDDYVRLPDEPEFYKTGRKPNVIKTQTGNRLLPNPCSFCKFISHCWPEAVFKPSAITKSNNPRSVWYSVHTVDDATR
jgi:hypothetical protein|tara:strand:+ start:1000 stop:1899 length:900 start_codon:yes stop_codon:yes gene_type:complete